MTMGEMKEFIMETVVENPDNNPVPEVEENDIRFMSRKEMKVRNFINKFMNDYVMVYDLGYH